MCDNPKLHVENYNKSHLIPTNSYSPPSGYIPPMVHHAPQNTTPSPKPHITSIPPKSVPASSSPRYARYGNHTHCGYVAGKLLATIDFSVSDIRKWAVLDSGATGNFFVTDAPLNDRTEAHEPLTVTLPDGNKVNSTHVGFLDIPRLPKQARIGHVIPGLNTHSLVSVPVLCNAGCEVLFTKIGVTVKYRGSTVLTGRKCLRTGLWMVPLTGTKTDAANILWKTPPKRTTFTSQDFYYLYSRKKRIWEPKHQIN